MFVQLIAGEIESIDLPWFNPYTSINFQLEFGTWLVKFFESQGLAELGAFWQPVETS